MVVSRKSKQKVAVLRVVKGTTSHPIAYWVYEQVRREIPNISLGTVYRNLKLLKQEGLILEIELVGMLTRFDGNTQYHHHFICEQCGRVFDVESDEAMERAMGDRVAQRMGFRITQHRCEFRGLCKDCQS
jgi:Fe2+ or Zn2+ uptake regulation protein